MAARIATKAVSLPRYRVLSRQGNDDGEVTMYIKGFLGHGESADNFTEWFKSHLILTTLPTHKWGGQCLGHSWHSGMLTSVANLPIPVATIAGALLVALRTVPFRWVTPMALIGAATADLAQVVGRLAYRYWQATSMAHEQADLLAEHLVTLRKNHDKVRLVAHSLGCRHAIAAVSSMTMNERPDTLHLCAPAVREVDVQVHLDKLAKQHTYVYYTKRDTVLTVPFVVMANGSALGATGPGRPYGDLTAIDVSKNFDMIVHTNYAVRFPYFAAVH